MYKYPTKLISGKFIRRYKRFLTDVQLPGGEVVTAHCTNTGSLKSCLIPGADVLLSPVNDPKRKTKYTWESIKIGDIWVGINTQIPNKLVFNALKQKAIPGLEHFDQVKSEVKFEDSRFDIFLENETEKMFAEVKNVTYKEGKYALFPDAPTQRGLKHLKGLIEAKRRGYRAAMIYVIPRLDAEVFAPARHIHPEYAEALREALHKGVEIYPLAVKYTETGAEITGKLGVEI
jgi:sugar fermentation stimulation protein A